MTDRQHAVCIYYVKVPGQHDWIEFDLSLVTPGGKKVELFMHFHEMVGVG